jgi:hypothetical protein
MLEYGLLSGMGGSIVAALASGLDSLRAFGDGALRLLMDHPAITLICLAGLLAWILHTRRR